MKVIIHNKSSYDILTNSFSIIISVIIIKHSHLLRAWKDLLCPKVAAVGYVQVGFSRDTGAMLYIYTDTCVCT